MNMMTFEKLQYNELKDIVKSYCVSGLGKELINKLEPSTSIKVVRNRLNETTEARGYIRCRRACAFFGISNIASTIQN